MVMLTLGPAALFYLYFLTTAVTTPAIASSLFGLMGL
jgi:hypothetical protein